MTTKPHKSLGTITSIASHGEKSRFVLSYILQSQAREILHDERVAHCMRTRIPKADKVEVLHKPGAKRAYYKNLIVCGSVWHCPVCASKITEHRRQELHAAVMGWMTPPALVTYTMQHNLSDTLQNRLNALLEAFRGLKSGRQWQEVKDHFGVMGSVRALEVTYGVNGWHCHIHELMFFRNEMTDILAAKFEWKLKHMWREALERHKATCDFNHGVKLVMADKEIADYVVKFGHDLTPSGWSVEHELVKFPTKIAKHDGRTPLQLLLDYYDGDMQARRIWREYATTFKGKHQLQWSKGMRALLGLGVEPPEAELAQETDDGSVLLATLTPDEWRAILNANVRAELLENAANMSELDFSLWLERIINEYDDDNYISF